MSSDSDWNQWPAPAGADSAEPVAAKRRGRRFILIALLTLVLLATCTLATCRRGPRTVNRVLSTGETIRVISQVKQSFPESGPALVFTYQTEHDLNPEGPLRREADLIMRELESDAESIEVTGVAIAAREEPEGWPLYTYTAYTFVYMQQPDGTWKLHED